MNRVVAIDWKKISNGSEGASFPEDLRRYLTKPSTDALDEIWEKQVGRPIGALASRFLMELLAHPDELGEVPYLLRLLVAMITHRHESWLGAPFAAETAGFGYSRLNKWSAIAERRDLVFKLLDHSDEKVRAHAAFLLAWLGRAYSGTIVPVLWEKAKDPSALVRASALLAIGVHGEVGPFEEYLKDEEPRVVVAAAIAATHASQHPLSDDVLDALGYAVNANVAWPDLPFCNGDLTSYALKCVLHLDERYAPRVRPWLKRHLDGPLAADITRDLIARTFPQGAEIFPLTDEKREVLALIVSHASTHAVAVEALAEAGFLLGTSRLVDKQINEVRKLAGLPRPPPSTGVLAEVLHEGEKRYAQHWMADYSEEGKPEPRALARSIAQQLSATDVVALLLAAHELESDRHSANTAATFETPAPAGGTPRDDRLIFPHEDWPKRARIFMNAIRAEGWFIESEWWHGTTVTVTAHRDGCLFTWELGNDWNQGDPIMTESYFRPRRHLVLSRLLAEEALTQCVGYEEALVAYADELPASQDTLHLAHRMTNIAIWTWGPRGEAPPETLDKMAIQMEAFWTYVQGPFLVYARLLDDARREALVLGVFAATGNRVLELYAIAPTKRVQSELVAEVKRHIKYHENDKAKLIASLEGQMGEHARTLVNECSSSARRRS